MEREEYCSVVHLIFIIPYEELRPAVEEVLQAYNSEEEIITSIFALKSWEIDNISFQGDVIISRGFTAQQLKDRYPDQVCVPLKITGFDILKTAQKAIQLYSPRKIALIGSSLLISGAENLSEVVNMEVGSYLADNYQQVPNAIAKARKDGCDCFLGGLSLLYHCSKDDRALSIETGKPAIIQTIDEAIRLTQRTRIERNQNDESLVRKKMYGKGLKAKYRFDDIITTGKTLGKVLNQARQFASVDSPILIVGESGTGKELFAQSIHNASSRRDGPFVAINCAALPEALLESELFGYSEGSFTGAVKGGKPGLFEMAHGGSIFLDEISEIPVSFQSKLLRVLQENEVRRIGDNKVLCLDIRIITATNKDLHEQVRRSLFRHDLLFRLNVLAIKIPPLRERSEDIFTLFQHCITEFSKKYHKKIAGISGEAQRLLEEHTWEGNVRELKNIAERICVLNTEPTISSEIVKDVLSDSGSTFLTPGISASDKAKAGEENIYTEREKLKSLMEQYNGNRGKIAGHLGVDRTTLWRKLKQHQIQ